MERDRLWLIAPWMNKCLSEEEAGDIYDRYQDAELRGEPIILCYFVQDHYPEIYARMRAIARLHGAEL